MSIPAHGLSPEELFSRLEMYKERDISWRAGKILTGIYDPGRETEVVVKEAYSRVGLPYDIVGELPSPKQRPQLSRRQRVWRSARQVERHESRPPARHKHATH